MLPWLGDEALHRSHRDKLVSKLPEYYAQHAWGQPLALNGYMASDMAPSGSE